jgi:hypothetical protein
VPELLLVRGVERPVMVDRNGAQKPPDFRPSRCTEIMCFPNAKSRVAKRLCLRRRPGYLTGGISEQGRQESITVDIGRFRVVQRYASSSPPPAA